MAPQYVQRFTLTLTKAAGSLARLTAAGIVALIVLSSRAVAERPEEFVDDVHTVLLMHFNEAEGAVVKDISRNANQGEILYAAQWTEEGIVGSALLFDGPQDCVKVVGNNKSLDIAEQLTVEAWIRISGGTRQREVVSKGGAYSLSVWHAPSNMLTARIDLESGDYHLVHSSSILREQQWYYVAMSFDGKTLKVFIDGKLAGAKEVAGRIKTTPEPLYISLPSGWQTFNGVIDEVRISNIARDIKPITKSIIPPGELKGSHDNPFLIVDGHPFFPIGLYCAIWWEEKNLEELGKAGFNLIGPRGDFAAIGDWKRFLDAGASHGLKTWVPLLYKPKSPDARMRWATFLCEPEEVEKAKALKELVSALKGHPGLLVWDIGDEVIGAGIPLEALLKGYRVVKELDPGHAVWTNHSFMSGEGIVEYSRAADVVSYDVYPLYSAGMVGAQGNPAIVGAYTSLLGRAVENNKPVWMVLQADHGHQGGRFPTEQELRFMTYQAIVSGATGIIYFGQDVTYGWTPEFRKAIKQVVSELRDLAAVLVSPAHEGKISLDVVPATVGIRGVCKEYGGDRYVIVVNEEAEELVRAKFLFPDEKTLSGVDACFEGRTVKFDKNSFADEFKPHDVHVYRIKGL